MKDAMTFGEALEAHKAGKKTPEIHVNVWSFGSR